MSYFCERCSIDIGDQANTCPSCELYNAAVAAQSAAAQRLAEQRFPGSKNAWLNEHGVFAYLDGICITVAHPDEALVFHGTTTRAHGLYARHHEELRNSRPSQPEDK